MTAAVVARIGTFFEGALGFRCSLANRLRYMYE
jgi:hypothetical protein